LWCGRRGIHVDDSGNSDVGDGREVRVVDREDGEEEKSVRSRQVEFLKRRDEIWIWSGLSGDEMMR